MGASSVYGGWLLAVGTILMISSGMVWSSNVVYDRNGNPIVMPIGKHGRRSPVNLTCSLSPSLVDEIAGYRPVAQQIADYILNGPMKGLTYEYLAEFVDTFGSRLTGTQNLEDSIDWLVNRLKLMGLQNVHTEDATVPVWRRGNESLAMLQPRYQQLGFLGLGGSTGTSPDGITAEIIVVNNFTDLADKAAQIPGKIVVYDVPFTTYHETVNYREYGMSMAAQYGAVAVLLRSVTSFSIYSPHTGWQGYYPQLSPAKIPGACITVEDAELFHRLTDRGETVVVNLNMEAQNFPDGTSRNTIAEWSGTTYPKEVVIVSGHLDSWDVGQGAMDDGGGAYISVMAPYTLKQMGLQTKRTVRTILWTSEETGYYNGAYEYAAGHVQDIPDFDVMWECDDGVFNPLGLSFSGTNEAACIVQEVLKLTDMINATQLYMPEEGSDTPVFNALGVPTGSLMNDNPDYYFYHHTDGDTMTVLDPGELDRCLVLWTVSSYVFADISVKLPRQ